MTIPSCSLPDDSANSYAFSELPFALAEPQTAGTNAFLAVMLTDTNLAQAESTLESGVAGDSSFPAGDRLSRENRRRPAQRSRSLCLTTPFKNAARGATTRSREPTPIPPRSPTRWDWTPA